MHILDQSQPPFLNYLDTNPERAAAEFYEFTIKLLLTYPPRCVRALHKSQKDDLLQDFVFHCIQNNFRILHKYIDMGKPFSSWLFVIANNFCLDFIRSNKLDKNIDKNEEVEGISSGLDDDIQRRISTSNILKVINKSILELGEKCQLLLKMAADEYSPKEIAESLRLTSKTNKHISDDLRFCRQKLNKILLQKGIDFRDWM